MKIKKSKNKADKKPLTIKIGVVGYSAQKFKELTAKAYINDAFNLIQMHYGDEVKYQVWSGLTNLGIPKLAYENAVERKWETFGIAPRCAEKYDLFPCGVVKFVGTDWGDESQTFINNIHILVRVGGGDQSKAEVKMAQERGLQTMEYDLKSI